MATQTFARLLLCGAAILTVLVAIPVVVTALGGAEAEQNQGPAVLASGLLNRGGTHIGVTVRDVEGGEDPSEGAVVEDVRSESPADAAGFESGDLIVEFDGERVRSARQLTRLVQETPAGRSVAATVVRAESRMSLNVTPERGRGVMTMLPDEAVRALDHGVRDLRNSLRRDPERVERYFDFGFTPRRGRLGVSVDAIGDQLADYFGVESGRGVLVTSVQSDSVAAAAGLQAGDVITAIDDRAVDDVPALRRRIARVEPGEEIVISVVRDRTQMSLTATFEAPEERRRSRRARSI